MEASELSRQDVLARTVSLLEGLMTCVEKFNEQAPHATDEAYVELETYGTPIFTADDFSYTPKFTVEDVLLIRKYLNELGFTADAVRLDKETTFIVNATIDLGLLACSEEKRDQYIKILGPIEIHDGIKIVSAYSSLERYLQKLLKYLKTRLSTELGPAENKNNGNKQRGPERKRRGNGAGKRTDSELKIIAALTEHHRFVDKSCMNWEPMTVTDLAKTVGMGKATVSDFFKKQFGSNTLKGHQGYALACREQSKLIVSLKLLNNEFRPSLLLNSPQAVASDGDTEASE